MIGFTTSGFFATSASQIAALRDGTARLQTQISTGKKLQAASDDPLAAAQLRGLARADALASVDSAAASRASADLKLGDSALQSIADTVTQAQTLATQAASATFSTSQRAAIGAQLAQLHDQLVALANSRDTAGHALFGGTTSGAAYTVGAGGAASYTGTASAAPIDLGEGQSVTATLTGPQVFNITTGGAPTDMFATIKTLADTLQSGAATGQAAAQAALGAFTAGLDTIAAAQTTLGARAAFVDVQTSHLQAVGDARASAASALGDTDISTTIATLQQTMLALEASQSSFARLSALNLFDRIT